MQILPLMYLGAKHMVTGYDHLLFLAGVIFFLYRLKDVALYVTLFAVGHSITLLLGVLAASAPTRTSSTRSSGFRWSTRRSRTSAGSAAWACASTRALAVLAFGLAHGFGLSTKLQDLALSPRRPRRQHDRVQRRRGARPVRRARGDPHRLPALAPQSARSTAARMLRTSPSWRRVSCCSATR